MFETETKDFELLTSDPLYLTSARTIGKRHKGKIVGMEGSEELELGVAGGVNSRLQLRSHVLDGGAGAGGLAVRSGLHRWRSRSLRFVLLCEGRFEGLI